MDNFTFENARWAFGGFCFNLALLVLLVRYIFTTTRAEIDKLKLEMEELREKQAFTESAVRVREGVCDERHR